MTNDEKMAWRASHWNKGHTKWKYYKLLNKKHTSINKRCCQLQLEGETIV